MGEPLLALTLHQPWAWAIASAGKRVENRTWVPPRSLIGSYLAIHAGKKLDREAVEDLRDDGHAMPPLFDLGAIVAVAKVSGWVRCGAFVNRKPEAFAGVTRVRAVVAVRSDWWVGPIGWVLDEVTAIEPVPVLGAQGLWRVPPAVAAVVRERHEARRP